MSITGHDVKAIVGDIDDAKVMEILALKPTLAELEQAAIWSAGGDEALIKSGHTLSAVAAEIIEILTEDEEEPPPPR